MPLTARLSRPYALLLAATLFAALPLHPQSVPAGPFSLPPSGETFAYAPTLTFDVVSVRESERTRTLNMGVVSPPHTGKFEANSITLQILLSVAYGSGPFKVANGPEWANDRYFRIDAKCDHSVDEQLARQPDDQARLEKLHMLQDLLAERFHLKAHWETRDGSVLLMTIAKGGLKMQPTPAAPTEAEGPDGAAAKPAVTGPGVHASGGPRGIEIDGDHFTTRALTTLFGTQLATPIVDRTGLPVTNSYSFQLHFSREGSSASDGDAYPSIFAAAQEQLGLKLEPSKGPVDTLVIDHIELPSLN